MAISSILVSNSSGSPGRMRRGAGIPAPAPGRPGPGRCLRCAAGWSVLRWLSVFGL